MSMSHILHLLLSASLSPPPDARLSAAIDLPNSNWCRRGRCEGSLREAQSSRARQLWLDRAMPVVHSACHCQGRYAPGKAQGRCQQNNTYDCEGFDALHEYFWLTHGGVVVELGAMSGYVGSESLILERAAGFRRVLIEADPSHRAERQIMAPDAVGVTAAVCGNRSAAPLHFIRKESSAAGFQGIVEFMAAEHLRKWFPNVEQAWLAAGRDWTHVDWRALAVDPRTRILTTEVACSPLTAIFDAIGLQWVDLFILDTEGAEISILRSIDWSRISFGLLVIEAYSPAGTRPSSFHQQVIDEVGKLAPGQYRVAHRRRGRNVWLVHTGLQAHTWNNQTRLRM